MPPEPASDRSPDGRGRPAPHNVMARLLLHRFLIGALAGLALIQGVAGLYRLADYRRHSDASLATEHWSVAFGPPTWLVLLLVALLASLAVMLVSRLPQSTNARWLALFSALLANGYGVIATAVSSPLFDAYMQSLPVLQGWGVDLGLLRGTGLVVAGIERLLWIGAWSLAGTVSIFFVCGVLGIAPSPHRRHADEALVVLWSFSSVSMALPYTTILPLVAVVLAALGVAAWWRERRRAPISSMRLFLPAVALAGLSALTALKQHLPVSEALALLALAGLLLLPAVRRVAVSRPRLLVVFPVLLATAAALSSATIPVALELMNVWVGVCMLVVLRLIVFNVGSLSAFGRRQALWFMSGWIGAAIAVALWQVVLWGGRLAGCSVDSGSMPCWLYRHQDWFVAAPLPILLLSLVIGLLYPGSIDAARLFRRTVVYGSMLILSLFVLGVSEALLGEFVHRGLPWETPPMVATGVLAVVLYPAKRLCDRGVERFLARILAWTDKRDAESATPT